MRQAQVQCSANLNPTGRTFGTCLHITDQARLVPFTLQPHRSILHAIDAPQIGLDFAKFDSKAAQLELVVF